MVGLLGLLFVLWVRVRGIAGADEISGVEQRRRRERHQRSEICGRAEDRPSARLTARRGLRGSSSARGEPHQSERRRREPRRPIAPRRRAPPMHAHVTRAPKCSSPKRVAKSRSPRANATAPTLAARSIRWSARPLSSASWRGRTTNEGRVSPPRSRWVRHATGSTAPAGTVQKDQISPAVPRVGVGGRSIGWLTNLFARRAL